LWASVLDEFELSPPELRTLIEACRTSDELEAIRTALLSASLIVEGSAEQPVMNPLFAAARAHRELLTRLLGALALPSDDEDAGRTPRQKRAAAAASARWRQRRADQEQMRQANGHGSA
jgi:hypothetical protein